MWVWGDIDYPWRTSTLTISTALYKLQVALLVGIGPSDVEVELSL